MQPANLTFTADGTPKSLDFDDIYFSQGQGAAESQYVFVEHNQLPERFRALQPGQALTIAETGFGTGLNFLVAWQNFRQHAPAGARLNFISCEKYPLTRAALQSALAAFPQFAELANALQRQYPPALRGFHSLEFGSVRLLLMFDDASHAYAELTASVDAWFLDGFAPSRNPEMWQPALFAQMRRLSHAGTTVATFTAARLVRDGLSGAGFALAKVPGFGRKRDMCAGRFTGLCGPLPQQAWPSAELPVPKPLPGRRVAIIGAGIAGATTAAELHRLGYQVSVFERHAAPAQDGSGNPQGAVYAKLSADGNRASQFYAQALILAQRQLAELPEQVAHQRCGLVQLAHDTRELSRQQALAEGEFIPPELATLLSADALSEHLGIPVDQPGLWFPDGGWLSPRERVAQLLASTDLEVHYQQDIRLLDYQNGCWHLHSALGERFSADQVIVCAATDTRLFSQTQHLPLKPVSGQISQLALTPAAAELKAVVCTDRYVMPGLNGRLTIGSTFRIHDPHTEVTGADHQQNIESLHQRLPALQLQGQPAIDGRAATRATTPDYLPLLGPVADPADLIRDYTAAIQKNLTARLPAAPQYPGLWLNVGHGSKGLCSAPLSARVLAALISGEPVPLQASLLQHLNPNRFTVRQIRRAQREKQ